MTRSKHPSEQQLVLYRYGEAGERLAIEEHLASCDSCRDGYQALGRVLAAVDAAPVPERGEDYGAEAWRRLAPRLADARLRAPVRTGLGWPRRWAIAAALAALIVAAFLAGRFSPRREPVLPTAAVPEQVRERILLVVVGDHLERSQMVLVELANAEPRGTVDISQEQQWARDLVGANRLYRQTAAGAGETGMASVLEELERALLEIAHSPARVRSAELKELRRRIEAQGILFKIRVVGSQLEERATGRF